MHLSRWLTERYGETPVFAIEPSGARRVSAAYEWLAQTLQPDAIILVDGGTDSLMRGDEAGLATPEGDAVSLLAAHAVPGIPHKLLLCLGFGKEIIRTSKFLSLILRHEPERVGLKLGDAGWVRR